MIKAVFALTLIALTMATFTKPFIHKEESCDDDNDNKGRNSAACKLAKELKQKLDAATKAAADAFCKLEEERKELQAKLDANACAKDELTKKTEAEKKKLEAQIKDAEKKCQSRGYHKGLVDKIIGAPRRLAVLAALKRKDQSCSDEGKQLGQKKNHSKSGKHLGQKKDRSNSGKHGGQKKDQKKDQSCSDEGKHLGQKKNHSKSGKHLGQKKENSNKGKQWGQERKKKIAILKKEEDCKEAIIGQAK